MSSASGERQGLGRFRALQLHSASTQCQHRKNKLHCKAGVGAMHFGLCKVCTALRPLAARNRRLKMKTWKKLFFFREDLTLTFSCQKKNFFSSQHARLAGPWFLSRNSSQLMIAKENFSHGRALLHFVTQRWQSPGIVLSYSLFVLSFNLKLLSLRPFTGCFLKFTRSAEKLSAICDHL